MASHILALDQGTTSSRAIVFDHNGAIRGMAQRELPQIYPHPGWVEHDPEVVWATQSEAAVEALAASRVPAAEVAGIGIANQRETTVVWERATLRPIHNAIVWQDRRTAGMIARLKEDGAESEVTARTGLVLDPYFSGSKLAWLLEHVEGARRRAERGELAFGTVDSWLLARLTHGSTHATDASNASRTMLYNIHEGDWDERMLELLRIPRALLPEVRSSSGVFGHTAPDVLGAAVAVAAIAGDQQAATFGQCCFAPGEGKNTYGTGAFMVMNTGEKAVPSASRLLTTVAWRMREATTYALEGSVFIAGAVVQWLRDQLGIIRRSEDVESLARSVEDSGGVVLVPAFTGLGAPHWDPYARGALLGLTRGSSAAHIARAALEGIACQVADVVRAMEADSGIRLEGLRVDGGVAANNLLLQLQADLLGVPVVRPRITETTALGAAYLAGLAVGLWSDRDELASRWAAERTFEPAMSADRRAALTDRWRRALERARDWETGAPEP
jgi:glycerol kinase